MLETEFDTSVQKVEEITRGTFVVDKLHFVGSSESRHTQPQLRIAVNIGTKECHCRIGGLAVLQEFELCEQSLNTVAFGRSINAATRNSRPNRPTNALLAQIGNGDSVGNLGVPRELYRTASAQTLVVHIARHLFGCALNPIVRTALIGVRHLSVFPFIKVKHNQLAAIAIRQFHVFGACVNSGLNLCQLLRNLALSAVGYLLSCYFQRHGGYAKYQTSAFGIQKGASRLHTVFQLASCFLQLKRAVLVAFYQQFYIFNCHSHYSPPLRNAKRVVKYRRKMFSPFPALDITSTKLITFFKVFVQYPCFQFARCK